MSNLWFFGSIMFIPRGIDIAKRIDNNLIEYSGELLSI